MADIFLETGARFPAQMLEISRYGCRLSVQVKLAANTGLKIRIFRRQEFIEAQATVIYADPELGTGLAFRAMTPDFEYLWKRWLDAVMEETQVPSP